MTNAQGNRGWVGVMVAATLLMLAAAIAAQAQSYSVFYTFLGRANGQGPFTNFVPDSEGNLYGTAEGGGSAQCQCGVIFRLDPAGNETVLCSFNGESTGDGSNPTGNLVRDEAGNLYGATYYGGSTDGACNLGGHPGCGVVFKLDPSGKETVLYTFQGGADGGNPLGGVIRDPAGNLYGTATQFGTPGVLCGSGCGVVFKVDMAGNEAVLYSFTGGSDGGGPESGLVRDSAGNLYGTARFAGNFDGVCSLFGCGVVFKLDPSGTETVLYAFTGLDGQYPYGGLVRDAAGNFYGTTGYGGSSIGFCGGDLGCGVLFKLDPAGNEMVLHNFTGADGDLPFSTLVQDGAGSLYGTANEGGAYGYGTIFEFDGKGRWSVLHNFTGLDGAYPGGTLFPFRGQLYSAAESGGSKTRGGAVFTITFP